jgi:hypothetical protein
MVFCALTNELVVKSEQAIKVHMGGKKFQKAQGEGARRCISAQPRDGEGRARRCMIRLALLTIFRS